MKILISTLLLFIIVYTATPQDTLTIKKITQINTQIEKAITEQKQWIQYPIQVALRYIEEPTNLFQFESVPHFSITLQPISQTKTYVIVVDKGWLDDSVNGKKTTITLEQKDNYWLIKKVKEQWICYRHKDGKTLTDDLDDKCF